MMHMQPLAGSPTLASGRKCCGKSGVRYSRLSATQYSKLVV